MPVLLQDALRILERIAPEWIAKLHRAHDFDDGCLALFLRVTGLRELRTNLIEVFNCDAFCTHGAGDLGKTGVFQIHPDETRIVEIDLILFLRPPLLVVENDRSHWDMLAHASEDLVETHTPSSIADIGDGWPFGRGHLGADDCWEGIAAISKTHCRVHALGPV